jgi:hypothetical protein
MIFRIVIALALFLMLLVLLPSGELPFWRGGQFSDVFISHWPNAQFTRFSLDEWGQIPLWNPTILSGMPFAADPLSGLWYPPNWIAVLHPSPLTFNLLFFMHLLWGAFGVWKLAQRLGVGKAGSVLAAIAFGMSPKLVGHVGLGHLSWVMATGWVPWAMLAFHNACKSRAIRRYALAGAALGLVFLIDPRWAAPLALMAIAFALREHAHSHSNYGVAAREATRGLVASGIFGLGVAAVGMLPLLELVRLTTRASLSLAERSLISIPWKSIIEVVVPRLGGWPETQTYFGLWIVILALVGAMVKTPRKLLWLATIAACWLVAMGERTPFFGAYGLIIPGASLGRVPARFLSLASLPVALMAGYGLEAALERGIKGRKLLALRVVLLGLLFSIGALAYRTGTIESILAIIWIVIIALLFFTFRQMRLARNSLAILAIAFASLDLAAVNLSTVEFRTIPQQPLSAQLDRQPGAARILSPSYSVSALTASSNGLQLADGVNPLQLQVYWDFMANALGFVENGYSITLPPFPDGDPSQPSEFSPRPDQLALLAVDTLVSSYPLDTAGFMLADQVDQQLIYRSSEIRHRAWLERVDGGRAEVSIDLWSPNRIRISAEGPGELVISELIYPGWQARVDGEKQEIQTRYGLLRSVPLADGGHIVDFRYVPGTFFLGLAITAVTVLGLVVIWRRS